MEELKERRARLIEEMAGLAAKLNTAEAAEDRAALEADWEARKAEMDNLNKALERDRLIAAERGREINVQPPVTRTPEIGMSQAEVRRYSIRRALAAAAGLISWDQAGLEKEASDAVARALGRQTKGVFLPWDVMERRDITVGAEGPDIVGVDMQAPIDLLRNKLVVRAAGAQVLTGLRGDVLFPQLSGGASGAWVTEGNAPAETTQTFGQVKLSPKQLAAYTDISRQTLLQASFDIDRFIANDLTSALAVAIDAGALHGTGTGGQPTGIINAPGVGLVSIGANGGAPTWSHIVQLEEQVAIANADVGTLAYITNPKVRRKLRVTEKATGTAQFVWTDDAEAPLNGYRALVTNNVASNLTKGTGTNLSAIFFGNWAECLIGIWAEPEVLIDPYTGGTAGTVRVITIANVDVGLRHAGSFAVIKDADTA